MEEKYKEFSDKFEALCEEFIAEDFNADEVKKVCDEVIENFSQ